MAGLTEQSEWSSLINFNLSYTPKSCNIKLVHKRLKHNEYGFAVRKMFEIAIQTV